MDGNIQIAGLIADGITVFARLRCLMLTVESPQHYRITYPYFKLTTYEHFDWLVTRLAACLHPPDPVVWTTTVLSTGEGLTFSAWINEISMNGGIVEPARFSFVLTDAWEPPSVIKSRYSFLS